MKLHTLSFSSEPKVCDYALLGCFCFSNRVFQHFFGGGGKYPREAKVQTLCRCRLLLLLVLMVLLDQLLVMQSRVRSHVALAREATFTLLAAVWPVAAVN